MVLFLNGIPVVTLELKCQFTGQDTANAIQQYKFDRAGKDAIFEFKNRVLVHFAVDLTHVYMTTRLEGEKTYFLPFNQGSNGAGNVGGKGNPINPDGYDTAYLWESVLCRDRLLEILHKYLHLQQEKDEKTGEVKSERMIFQMCIRDSCTTSPPSPRQPSSGNKRNAAGKPKNPPKRGRGAFPLHRGIALATCQIIGRLPPRSPSSGAARKGLTDFSGPLDLFCCAPIHPNALI